MEKSAMIRELLFCLDMERRQTLRPQFEKLGLTPGQPGVLKALLKKTEITQKELAQMCHVDQTTLSRNLDKLVQAGYVKRKTDEECRRCFLISLTETGKEKAKEVCIVFQNMEKRLTSGLSEEEKEQLYNYLERMLCNMRTENVLS